MYDVIVIGGGPVGSYTAYKLAGMGYDVVVLEQKEGIGENVCCTGIISRVSKLSRCRPKALRLTVISITPRGSAEECEIFPDMIIMPAQVPNTARPFLASSLIRLVR